MNTFTTDVRLVLKNGVSFAKVDDAGDAQAVCAALNLFECTPGLIAKRLAWAKEAERVLREAYLFYRRRRTCNCDPESGCGEANILRDCEQLLQPTTAAGIAGGSNSAHAATHPAAELMEGR